MAAEPTVIVHPDPDLLVAAVAARLVTAVLDAQAVRGRAHVVVTGGGTGIAALAAVRAEPARAAVDWSSVDIWWGDERFVPAADPDRNELQAREALLDALPLDPARVHAMPPSDGPFGDDVDAAAAGYAAELAAAAGSGQAVPAFDVLMFGVGPDGHVASLFPDHPGRLVTDAAIIPVRDSPKPPPTRISFTWPTIEAAREVWLLAAGEGKAEAVARALQAGDLPAASARGRERTLWLLDRAAVGKL